MNVSDEDVLDAVDGVRTPVATVAMVAGFLPIGRRAVLNRLNDLHDEGRVERLTVGAKSAVWWVPDSDERTDGPPSAVERTASVERTPPEPPGVEAASPSRSYERTADGGSSYEGSAVESSPVDAPDEAIDRALRDWMPGRLGADDVDDRREAGRKAIEFIRDADRPVLASDIRDALFPAYQIGSESASSWWRRTARPAVTRARDAGLVEFQEGHKTWHWTGGHRD